MAQKVIRFPENVMVGKFYTVPCVKNAKGEFIPISSYLHEDKKVINVPHKHWHIDWRFVSKEVWAEEIGSFDKDYRGKREAGIALFLISKQNHGEWNPHTTTFYKKVHYVLRKCIRKYRAAKFYDIKRPEYYLWPQKLSEVFCGSKLKQKGDTLICPHKGVLIDKNCKDKEGNYVCPGHLLRFNPSTLTCLKNE